MATKSKEPNTLEVNDSGKVNIRKNIDVKEDFFSIDNLTLAESQQTTAIKPPNKKELYISGSELIGRKIESIPCLLDPIFPKVGLITLAGSSDTGKSSILRQFAISVASGMDKFLDFDIKAEHKRALYVSTEDDETAISYLLNKANKDLQISDSDYSGLNYLFEVADLAEQIRTFLEKKPCDVVMIDAFTDVYGNSMNESNKVRVFLNQFSQIAQHYQCLVIFLHHSGKRTEENIPSKHNLLGSQGFEAKMRLVVELRLDSVNPDLRHFCIVKGNYLGREHKNESYVLKITENQTFYNTNERVDFEELRENKNKSLVEEAKELSKKGTSQREIAEKLGKSLGTINRWLKL